MIGSWSDRNIWQGSSTISVLHDLCGGIFRATHELLVNPSKRTTNISSSIKIIHGLFLRIKFVPDNPVNRSPSVSWQIVLYRFVLYCPCHKCLRTGRPDFYGEKNLKVKYFPFLVSIYLYHGCTASNMHSPMNSQCTNVNWKANLHCTQHIHFT